MSLLPPFSTPPPSSFILSFIAHPVISQRFREEASPAREVIGAYYFSKDIVEDSLTPRGSFDVLHRSLQLRFRIDWRGC